MYIYRVTEYTPQFMGYRFVPFSGMQPQITRTDCETRIVCVAKKSEIKAQPGRSIIVKFLGRAGPATDSMLRQHSRWLQQQKENDNDGTKNRNHIGIGADF